MKNKILILKNDRTGDLFVSLKTINRILNKHSNDEIEIILSPVNYKFNFLFKNIKFNIFNMKLNFFEKLRLTYYIFNNNFDIIYILSPKNFFYYLPIIFRKIKFFGITIKSKTNRPNNFLKKYLYKYVELDRINIKKRLSSYNIQENLIELNEVKDCLNLNSKLTHNFSYPDKFCVFHYKHSLFSDLLNWSLNDICNLIDFLHNKCGNILFSSEINNKNLNNFFSERFNTFDFDTKKEYYINKKSIIFLKNIDGYDLFDLINKSTKVISPEGIMTHISYFLKKDVLALIHFKLKNKQDFINQIISCKEWFPPDNYKFSVLKKDFKSTLKKLEKRI